MKTSLNSLLVLVTATVSAFLCWNVGAMAQTTTMEVAEVIVDVEVLSVDDKTANVRILEMLRPEKQSMLHDFVGRNAVVIKSQTSTLLKGKRITLLTKLGTLGTELTLIELGSATPMNGTQAQQSLNQYANQKMMAQINQANHVVVGEVIEVHSGKPSGYAGPRSEHLPNWGTATIKVNETLKGASSSGGQLKVRYAASEDIVWYQAPKPVVKQQGVFIIGKAQVILNDDTLSAEADDEAGSIVSPDQIIPLSDYNKVRSLMRR